MKQILLIILAVIAFSCTSNYDSQEFEVIESVNVDTVALSAEYRVEEQLQIIETTTPETNDKIYGDINYVVEDTMIVMKPTTVNVTVSNGVSVNNIISEVNTFTEGNVITEIIRIAPVMHIALIGDNFIITPITDETQFLEDGDYTIWQWDVTPLLKGTHKLTLTVDITLENHSKNIETYEDFIYVYSDKSTWAKIGDFFSKEWKWLASTLIIPVGVFLYRKKKKNTNIKIKKDD